ncbi:hypothetical protein OE88DRAFT_138705 [Heliocybe sulcata]|uniref:Uncharacterized protein n=1 Tax=Heliocybe sulcata TaxID=5364 RepID=A0A5C3NJR3_9AGAM|nr:hypothetical protein OE88DRAFT_138705 [Heliocybe sulcata]
MGRGGTLPFSIATIGPQASSAGQVILPYRRRSVLTPLVGIKTPLLFRAVRECTQSILLSATHMTLGLTSRHPYFLAFSLAELAVRSSQQLPLFPFGFTAPYLVTMLSPSAFPRTGIMVRLGMILFPVVATVPSRSHDQRGDS